MSGMSGVSGSGSMPMNCKMQGMHGNTQKPKSEDLKQDNLKQMKAAENGKGMKFDMSV